MPTGVVNLEFMQFQSICEPLIEKKLFSFLLSYNGNLFFSLEGGQQNRVFMHMILFLVEMTDVFHVIV